ncbi:hypothetical protein [Gracilinema caldarium]|uniref:hypothetical protein n=1 Tax=Gracilinema caldarium TaxID=215591 RepID=UPI0026ECC3AA|nr:hypothetical protein [Gracilinema caldarium]
MIEMSFNIRFYSQFHRTRPELLSDVQQTLNTMIQQSGGKVTRLGRELLAEFSEEKFAFSIQFFSFIRQLVPFCDDIRKKLLGFYIIFQKDTDSGNDRILKSLFHIKKGTGIYFFTHVATLFSDYFLYEQLPNLDITQLKEIKQVPETKQSVLEELYGRFSAELDVSQAQCKILIGNDTDLLYFLGKTYAEKKYDKAIQFYFGFNPGTAALNGFIELFANSIKIQKESFTEFDEKISLLKVSRLHEVLNEPTRVLLYEMLETWLEAFEEKQVVLHISRLDAINIALQDLIKQFLVKFLKSPFHMVFITAQQKDKLEWLDGVERQYVISQFSNRLWRIIPESSDTRFIGMQPILTAAYLCHLLSYVYSKSEIPAKLRQSGFSSFAIEWMLMACDTTCILPAFLPDYSIDAETEKNIQKRLSTSDREHIFALVQELLLASVSQHELNPGLGFLESYKRVGGTADPDLILDSILQDLSEGYFPDLNQASQSKRLVSLVGNDLLYPIQYIMMTDHVLVSGSYQDMKTAQQSEIPSSVAHPRINAYCHMNAAILRLSTGDLESAAKEIKQALLLLQDYKNKKGMDKLYRIFGLIELAHHRIEDAIEYLSFSLEAAHRAGNIREKALAEFFTAVSYFLLGNVPRAIFFANQAMQTFMDINNESWTGKTRFLLGRIQFVMGNYAQASDLFNEMSNNPIAAVWFIRSSLYSVLGNRAVIEQLNQTFVSSSVYDPLLHIELMYFLENYDECITLCDEFLGQEKPFHALVTEQADWTSGYSQIEGLLFPHYDFEYRQAICYKALAQSKLQSAASGSINLLDSILDELKPGLYDPYDVFYYNCYYLVTQRIGTSEIDRATALSGAFKRLQKRASRIEDAELRRHYLTANYWNGLLSSAAKLHNLI